MSKQKLNSLLSKWKTTSRKVKSSSIISVVLISVIFTTIVFNEDLLITVMGVIIKTDNSVDADSNIDGVGNYGNDGATSYLDAQSLDGTDQVIDETTENGGGGSSIRAKILDNELIDDRHYSPIYREGYRKYGQEITLGVPTYQQSNGNWYPNSSWQLSYENNTHFGYFYNTTSGETERNTSVVYKEYAVKGGRFESIFYNNSNEIRTNRFSFKQQPDRVGVLNADTEEFTKWQDKSKPSDIVLNIPQKRLTYKDVYTDTDVIFTYDGERLKEVIHAKRASYPATPYPLIDSYVVFFTKIFDFDLVQQEENQLKLHDDSGEIIGNKTVAGLLKMKNIAGKIVAYLPLGTATSNGMPDENVVWRVRKINNVWYILAGIRYGWLTHVNRVNPVFIDPTWIIGEDAESWGDNVDFYQTMENTTTGYAHLYPSNTTGNITSRVGQAMKNWIKIKWEGDNHSKSVDIFWNSSKDNGVSDSFEIQAVKINSSPNIWYNLPVQEKYGSWRLVLTTDNPSITSEIYNVTVQNDPPDATDFGYYKEIEINSGEVDGSGSHSDFAFLLNLTDSDLVDNCQADFDDIAFSNDTAWLDHEIEDYNSGTGLLLTWIRIPSLSTSSNTTIYMYYGNATIGAQENPTGVWDSDYMAVWHMPEDPSGSSPQILDSTSNDNDGTSFGSMTTEDQVDSQIDGALDFDGSDDLINTGDVNSDLWSGITVQLWIFAVNTDDERLICKSLSGDREDHIISFGVVDEGSSSDVVRVRLGTDGVGGSYADNTADSATFTTDAWHHVAFTWDSISEMIYIYIDGSPDSSYEKDGDSILDSNLPVILANVNTGDDERFYEGILDEVRMSNVSRSADWIATEYNNQYDYDSFFDIGIEQMVIIPYRLEWEHQCQNVPYTNMDSFNLTIYGNSSDSEDFLVQLWNETSSDWIDTTFYIGQSETWYNFSIDVYSAGVIGSNITWRYLDNISTSDFTLTTLRLDYAGIFYWNYSIDLIETTWNLANYDATIDDWQAIPENPFNISIASFFDFDIQIQGVDVSGSPVASNYVRVSNTSDVNNGFNLTTGYQTILSDQSLATTEVQFWMFVAYPLLGGNEGTTFTWTIKVKIIKA